MAVYEKTFRRYTGALTPRWSRFAVIRRFAAGEVFASRLVTGFFALSFAVPLGAAVLIYLRYNASALEALHLSLAQLLPVDAAFFRRLLVIQGSLAFFLTALVGPALVAPDLAHGALALYLSRPLSRSEYVLGKLLVLALPLSLMTWVPGLVLVALQAHLEEGWLAANARVPWAIFAASWSGILMVSLVVLALSAWVRWRVVATVLFLGMFLGSPGLATMIDQIFRTGWGDLVNPGKLLRIVWQGLFTGTSPAGELPVWAAAAGLAALLGLCALLLRWKLRAVEVVR